MAPAWSSRASCDPTPCQAHRPPWPTNWDCATWPSRSPTSRRLSIGQPPKATDWSVASASTRAPGGWPPSGGGKGSSARWPSASAEPRNARICRVDGGALLNEPAFSGAADSGRPTSANPNPNPTTLETPDRVVKLVPGQGIRDGRGRTHCPPGLPGRTSSAGPGRHPRAARQGRAAGRARQLDRGCRVWHPGAARLCEDEPVRAALADIHLPGAKGEQPVELGSLIAVDGFDIQVQPVLGKLRPVRHEPEVDLERATIGPDRHAVATAVNDLPAQRPGPELGEQFRVCSVDDEGISVVPRSFLPSSLYT